MSGIGRAESLSICQLREVIRCRFSMAASAVGSDLEQRTRKTPQRSLSNCIWTCAPMVGKSSCAAVAETRLTRKSTYGRRIHRSRGRKESLFAKDVQSYAQALRKIAGDITGETKREKRDAIRLRTLTPEKIEAWRIEFIRRKATDPLKEKSARISVGSFILRARSLFSAETVARVRDLVEIPEPMPFSGIKVETVRVPRYRSTFDMVELLESAQRGAGHVQRPEQYKIFLLGRDGRLETKRNRRAALDRVSLERRRDTHRDDRVLSSEVAQFRRRRPRGSGTHGGLPRISTRGAKATSSSRATRHRLPFDAPYGVYRCHDRDAGAAWLASLQRRRLKDAAAHACARNLAVRDQCPLRHCLPPASSCAMAALR